MTYMTFLIFIIPVGLGYYIGLVVNQKGIDISKTSIKLICFSSLVLWVIPLLGIVISSFTSTLGEKNKHTRLGKIYMVVGVLGCLLSFAMWMNNVSSWLV